MLLAALLLAAFVSGPDAFPPEVLVKRDVVSQSEGEKAAVLGWRRVAAGEVRPGEETVPAVFLDLLEGTSEPLFPQQWGLEAIGAPGAWSMTTGDRAIVIAVIDSGLSLTHPDLADRIFTNPAESFNGQDDDDNGLIDDVYGWNVVDWDSDPSDTVGHGTEVASVAVASINGFGMAGVAPRATVLPIRACTQRCDLLDVAWAIVYATDMGADVINLSLGGFAQPGPLGDAVEYAQEAGVLVVAAAGNTGADIDDSSFVPAGLPGVLTVAATDSSGKLWSGSNWGATVVDLGAPGVGVIAASLQPADGHVTGTGTSYSAPHVAGVAALMLSVRRDLTAEDVISLLTRHGSGLGSLALTTSSGREVRADRSVGAARWRDLSETVFDVEIVSLGLLDITRGCNPPTNDRYCPDRVVTRGEMAAFLSRALGLGGGTSGFVDVAGSVFRSDIDAIAGTGITRGCNPPANDRYCPDRMVTRGEMAAFVARAFGLGGGHDHFTDIAGSPFAQEIRAVAAAGISRGCNPPANDRYCPHRPITRGEMAAFITRALD